MIEESSASNLGLLGISGGVGAGKSTAARALADALHATLLDADAMVENLFKDPQVIVDIELKLGITICDETGAVDRPSLAQLVFTHPSARKKLESVLHPGVRRLLWQNLDHLEKKSEFHWVVLDIPLLYEGGLHHLCDFVVHVAVPEELRCLRACRRHGWNQDQWRAREQVQIPEIEKAARADAILENQAGRDSLLAQIRTLAPKLHCLAPRPLRERWPSWDTQPLS